MGPGSETGSKRGGETGGKTGHKTGGKTGSETEGETGQNKIILGFRVPTKMLQCKVPTSMRVMG